MTISCEHTGRQMEPDFDKAWEMVLADDRLKSIRKKLSIHEMRQLFYVAVEGLSGLPQPRPDQPPQEQT